MVLKILLGSSNTAQLLSYILKLHQIPFRPENIIISNFYLLKRKFSREDSFTCIFIEIYNSEYLETQHENTSTFDIFRIKETEIKISKIRVT